MKKNDIEKNEEKLKDDKETKIENSDEGKAKEETPESKDEEPEKEGDKKSEAGDEEDKETSKEEKSEGKEDKETSKENVSKDESKKASKPDYSKFYEPYIDSSVDKYKKKKKVLKTVAISFVSLILLVYFGGVIYFYSHFDSNTYINEFNVSWMSVDEVEDVFNNELTSHELEIVFKNTTETVAYGDGELEYSLAKSIKDIKKKQNPFIWFINIFNDQTLTVEYKASYDEAGLKEYINSFNCMKKASMQESVDAYVEMKDGEVVIVSDVTNTELDKDKVYEAVVVAITDYEDSVNIEENDCYIKADITADSATINNIAAEAEEFLSLEASYDFKGYEVAITRADLSAMAYIDGNGHVQIDKEEVENYANMLAETYTTVKTERVFETTGGKKILIYGGYYGWELDPEKEAEELYELLCLKEDFTKEPASKKQGYAMCEMNDIGDSYVEIDFLAQTLYVYIDGELKLETPIVSGNMSRGYKTPGGLYCIDNRVYDTRLVGETWDLHVNMWMGFNGSIGMHDAPWRWEYGGDIYTYNGSHGCVNIPYKEAMEAIDICEVGMPVVAYWLDEVEEVK